MSKKQPKSNTKKTTAKGPHGGGTKYEQMKVSGKFMVHDPIAGHKQEKNVDK